MSKREYSLSVWMKYTSCPVKRKIGGCYEFTLNNTVILPLITKDTKLFPDDATIVSFEYITSDYISYIGAAVMQKLTFVRNNRRIRPMAEYLYRFIEICSDAASEYLRKAHDCPEIVHRTITVERCS